VQCNIDFNGVELIHEELLSSIVSCAQGRECFVQLRGAGSRYNPARSWSYWRCGCGVEFAVAGECLTGAKYLGNYFRDLLKLASNIEHSRICHDYGEGLALIDGFSTASPLVESEFLIYQRQEQSLLCSGSLHFAALPIVTPSQTHSRSFKHEITCDFLPYRCEVVTQFLGKSLNFGGIMGNDLNLNVSLNIGCVEINGADALRLRPGCVIEFEHPAAFETVLKIGGADWALGKLEFDQGIARFSVEKLANFPEKQETIAADLR